MAYRDRSDRDVACEIPLNDELLTSFSGRGRRPLRDLKQQTETVLKLDKNKSCLQVQPVRVLSYDVFMMGFHKK